MVFRHDMEALPSELFPDLCDMPRIPGFDPDRDIAAVDLGFISGTGVDDAGDIRPTGGEDVDSLFQLPWLVFEFDDEFRLAAGLHQPPGDDM